VEGSKVQIAPVVSTEKSAKVILKYWDRKYRRAADLLVIEGPSAGGHLGFTKDQLALYDRETYEEEIRRIREVVREYEERYDRKIPVFLAGGIESHSDVMRALALGMDGVQVATRFVTTEECDADIRYKEAYLNAKEEDIVIVKSPVGMPGRAILNPFMRRVMSGEQILHSPCHGCIKNCRPQEIPYCITDALIAAAKGDTEHALLFCGKYAYRAQKIETVKEVIASLLDPCV
jgi:NAD(P)H-dependent flavin oxidoreductase YrpB (nitropropane dioxygenase family)